MADNWNLRGKTQMLDDLNTPSLQCRVYDRIAVQDSKGKTHFYCLELSAGNTFDFGFCRKENVPSLLRDVMTMGSIRVLSGICDDLMVPTVPTVLWIKQARKYDPKHVIMWLENSIELTEEYKDITNNDMHIIKCGRCRCLISRCWACGAAQHERRGNNDATFCQNFAS